MESQESKVASVSETSAPLLSEIAEHANFRSKRDVFRLAVAVGLSLRQRTKIDRRESSMKWSVGSLDDDYTIREVIKSMDSSDHATDLVGAMEEYAEYGVKYLHSGLVDEGRPLSTILTVIVDAAQHSG